AAAEVGSLPGSKVTVSPSCCARAVIASSGATKPGLFEHARDGSPLDVQTVAALTPLVGVADAVGPIMAIFRPLPDTGRIRLFFRSTLPSSATRLARAR